MALTLKSPLSLLFGVGPKNQKLLKKLNLTTCEDLLYYFPNKYEDYSRLVLIKNLKPDEPATLRVKLKEIYSEHTPRQRLFITHTIFADSSGELEIVWFNQPFLNQTFKADRFYWLAGFAKPIYPGINFEVKEYEAVGWRQIHTGRILPIYSLTKGLTNRYLRLWLSQVLSLTGSILEFLPTDLISKEKLLPLGQALAQIHFPDSNRYLTQAKNRLAFDELFLSQLRHQVSRSSWQKLTAAPIPFNLKLTKKIIAKLPFKLTNDQRKASWQIVKDLKKNQPMNRLLEGDVASGKTIVAILALAQAAAAGREACLMAPTKLLAKQHYLTVKKILSSLGFKLKLLSQDVRSVYKRHNKIKQTNKKGTIYIGTHSLIEDRFNFNNLALAIIDEQHRFGVRQRAELISKTGHKNTAPHLLSLSATPIPRTLALTAFGDLDLSILDELPAGRKKIITKIVNPLDRNKAYDFIKNRLIKNEQAFVIYPLVYDSNKLAIKSATAEYQRLKKEIFPMFKVGLVHGRVKTDERDEIIKKFRDGQLQILVATAVVEVGIDIPGATIMIIEHSERFGLAQLHQFRGRIARRQQQGYCFLFTESKSEKTNNRLRALINCHNGFELAKQDLALRGPGEVFGTSQSGWPEFKMANIFDYQLTLKAKQAAKNYYPRLEACPLLKEKLKEFVREVHFE